MDRRPARRLSCSCVLAFPPIVHDLVIGNVSTITVLALLAVARWQDPRGGVAIGLLMVLMPKPHLIPVLAYLAFRRPRDFAAAALTMGAGVLVGLADLRRRSVAGVLRDPARAARADVHRERRVVRAARAGRASSIGVAIGVVVFVVGVRLGGARGYGLSILGRDPRRSVHLHPLPLRDAGRRRADAAHAPALADAVPVAADRLPAHPGVADGAGRGRSVEPCAARGGSGAASSSARLTSSTRGSATSWKSVASSQP